MLDQLMGTSRDGKCPSSGAGRGGGGGAAAAPEVTTVSGRPAGRSPRLAGPGPAPSTTTTTPYPPTPPPTPPPAGWSLPGPQDSGGVGASGAAVPGAEGGSVPAELPAPAVVRAAGGRAALSAAVSDPLPAKGAPAGAFSRGSPLREAAVCQIQIVEVGGKQIKKSLPDQQLLQYLRDFFFCVFL